MPQNMIVTMPDFCSASAVKYDAHANAATRATPMNFESAWWRRSATFRTNADAAP